MTTVFLGSVILGAMLLFVAVVVLLAIASLLEIPRDRDEPVRLEVEGEVSSGSRDRPSGIAKFSSR